MRDLVAISRFTDTDSCAFFVYSSISHCVGIAMYIYVYRYQHRWGKSLYPFQQKTLRCGLSPDDIVCVELRKPGSESSRLEPIILWQPARNRLPPPPQKDIDFPRQELGNRWFFGSAKIRQGLRCVRSSSGTASGTRRRCSFVAAVGGTLDIEGEETLIYRHRYYRSYITIQSGNECRIMSRSYKWQFLLQIVRQ